jgi:hypothetical protein
MLRSGANCGEFLSVRNVNSQCDSRVTCEISVRALAAKSPRSQKPDGGPDERRVSLRTANGYSLYAPTTDSQLHHHRQQKTWAASLCDTHSSGARHARARHRLHAHRRGLRQLI